MSEIETLDDWSDEQQKSAMASVATAKYGVLSESIRGSMAEARLCSMFCGGKNCKYESAAKWTPEQQAINGLYSNWVTNNILAMARPNTEQINKHDIVDQFKKSGIKSIFNLQLCGEHASCGPGLESSGFTYIPQEFMDNGVDCYNFGWHDYNVGSLTGIADVVRVMQFALSQGKVAVHCHAGLGRTGVLIACYLIFSNRIDPDIAINYVRRKRQGAVQSRCQIKCIRDFAEFLRPSRIVFSGIKPKVPEFTLSQFLSRQRFAVHGDDARRLRYLPKIVYVCCERLLEIASRQCTEEEHKQRLFIFSDRLLSRDSAINRESLFYLDGSSRPELTNGRSETSSVTSRDQSVAGGDAFRGVSTKVMRIAQVSTALRTSISCDSLLPMRTRTPLETFGGGGSGTSSPLLPQLVKPSHSTISTTSPVDVSRKIPVVGSSGKRVRRSSLAVTATGVINALACVKADYEPEVLVAVDDFKRELNVRSTEWQRVREENEPHVLAALMWDWLDELKEPVISIQDLPLLLENTDHPIVALNTLDKGPRQTIAYLFYTIACLEPMTPEQRTSIIQRAISTLTHQNMTTELDDFNLSMTMSVNEKAKLLSRSSNDGRMRSNVAKLLSDFFTTYLRQIKVCACSEHWLQSNRLPLPPSAGTSRRPQSRHKSRSEHY